MRSERYKLLDYVVNDDMEGLDEIAVGEVCSLCGRPTTTYSVAFCSPLHLRCCARLWEGLIAHGQHTQAESMLALYRGAPRAEPLDELDF